MRDLDDTDGAAEYLGTSPWTVKEWRYHGTGPTFVRVGRSIRYRKADVDAWLESRTVDPATLVPDVDPNTVR